MKLELKNCSISYEVTSEGIPLLLIHGYPLSSKIWKPQVDFLSQHGIKVITLDLRGFGESTVQTDTWTMNDLADDVTALLDCLKIEKCFVGGMSMGGYILLNMMERFSHRISGAIFIATRANADDEPTKQRRTFLIESAKINGAQPVSEAFKGILFSGKTLSSNPSLVEAIENIMLNTSMNGIVGGLTAIKERKDYTSSLMQFNIPSLIIHGNDDKAVLVDNAKSIAEKLPNSKLVVIQEGGHMVNMECPDEVNQAILSFIRHKWVHSK